MIEAQQATVFIGATRRYFSKRAAQRSFAVAAMKRRCECDMGDHVTPPYFCKYHDYKTGLFDKLAKRFVAINFRTPDTPKETDT